MSPLRLGKVLKALREEKRLTQVELAKRAKVAQSYVAELERGEKKNPSFAVLQRLAKALSVTVTELLDLRE